MVVKLPVPAHCPPTSLEAFLRDRACFTSSLWRRLKWQGRIFVNGKPVFTPTRQMVSGGDEVMYMLADCSQVRVRKGILTILYEDEWLLIVDKPAGQIIHPTTKAEQITLVNVVAHYLQLTGQDKNCHPVYRLDRNTTGVVVVAKRPQIQAALQSHAVLQREYQALIEGCIAPTEAMLNSSLGRKSGSIIERCVDEAGQSALTYYQVMRKFPHYSLLKLILHTGRTHQIRVHLASQGYPLLGDDLYGGRRQYINRQALHAARVRFTHPCTGEQIDCTSLLPLDMQKLIGEYHALLSI